VTVPRAESESGLSGEVRALFADLAHGGEMAAAGRVTAGSEGIFHGEAGSREQGTLVRVQLRIALADRTVREMRYRAFGCPYTLAVCEWLARQLGGRTLGALSGDGLTEAVGTAARWCEGLSIPPGRLGRLLIIEDALLAALRSAAAK
jgi:NifU-like protein involved in Fe-S cluster formation